MKPKNPIHPLSKPEKPTKKNNSFALGMAVFLGIFSGALPFACPLNVLTVLILAFFRIPLLTFLFFFLAVQLGIHQYWEANLNAWGLEFLTAPSSQDFARRLAQAPFLCFLRLNNSRVCGGMLLGIPAGALLGLLAATLAGKFRKPKLSAKEESPA